MAAAASVNWHSRRCPLLAQSNMLNALTNVRFWGQSGPVTNRCLPISISQYTAKLALKTEKEKDAKAGSKVRA